MNPESPRTDTPALAPTSIARRVFYLVLALVLDIAPLATYAQGHAATASNLGERVGELNTRIEAILTDKRKLSEALRAGKKASATCAHCHGVDGNSTSASVPNLAGQNPSYLLIQIQKFADGHRLSSTFMQRLVKVLRDDEIVNISVYFASVEARPSTMANPALVAAGGLVFTNMCQQCHKTSARGDMLIPRLAGQKSEYLSASLTRYRSDTGERQDPQMQAAAARLTDDQIKAVAVYLSSRD